MNNNENKEEVNSSEPAESEDIFSSTAEKQLDETKDLSFEIPDPEIVEGESEPSTALKTPKRTFLDFNFSWIMLIIDMAVIVGVGTLNIQAIGNTSFGASVNSTLYILLTVVISALIGLISYVGGKVIGGLIGGYRLLEIDLLGFSIYFPGNKMKTIVNFKVSNIFDLHLIMIPKAEKKPNHFFYLLGGMIGYLLVTAIFFVLAFTLFKKTEWLYLTVLFGMVYAFLIPFYQLFPCRLDYPNDCFLLIKTRKAEDCLAYNLELTNMGHSVAHEDFETATFDNYETYFKSHMLYFLYLEKLYADDIDAAVELLTEIQRFRIYYPSELRIKVLIEKLYLLLLSDSFEDADRVYSDLTHDDQKALSNNTYLTQFRSSLLIEAFIKNSMDDAQKVIDQFIKTINSNEIKSNRLKKEIEMFEIAVKKVQSIKTEWTIRYELVQQETIIAE